VHLNSNWIQSNKSPFLSIKRPRTVSTGIVISMDVLMLGQQIEQILPLLISENRRQEGEITEATVN